jgi:hypothetical protein
VFSLIGRTIQSIEEKLNLESKLSDIQAAPLDDVTIQPLASYKEENTLVWDQKLGQINEELNKQLQEKGLRSPTMAQLL